MNANQKDYKMLEYLSFKDLKNELKVCRNPEKELIIRKLMKDKAIKYKLKKQDNNLKYNRQPIKKQSVNFDTNAYVKSILDELDDDGSLDDKDIYQDGIDGRDGIDKRKKNKKKYMKKDLVNNSLMDRMNNELDLRKYRKKGKKEFLMPFAENAGNDYASFKGNNRPITSFSNYN